VIAPNAPSNGVSRWNVAACRQSTSPETTGMIADRNARVADAAAIPIAVVPAHLTPIRLIATKPAMIPHARSGTDIPGRNHCLIADAESRAVSPQVGTQSHQYDTPVRLPSTGA
jgi:hypothetical protein